MKRDLPAADAAILPDLAGKSCGQIVVGIGRQLGRSSGFDFSG